MTVSPHIQAFLEAMLRKPEVRRMLAQRTGEVSLGAYVNEVFGSFLESMAAEWTDSLLAMHEEDRRRGPGTRQP